MPVKGCGFLRWSSLLPRDNLFAYRFVDEEASFFVSEEAPSTRAFFFAGVLSAPFEWGPGGCVLCCSDVHGPLVKQSRQQCSPPFPFQDAAHEQSWLQQGWNLPFSGSLYVLRGPEVGLSMLVGNVSSAAPARFAAVGILFACRGGLAYALRSLALMPETWVILLIRSGVFCPLF